MINQTWQLIQYAKTCLLRNDHSVSGRMQGATTDRNQSVGEHFGCSAQEAAGTLQIPV